MSKKSVGNILTKGNDFGQTGQSFAGSQNPIEEQINELGRNETDYIFSYRKQLKALRMS
ncbi:unnamed protein product [Paramecium sonneborni]|uniref:Uncharacterized protein n=1 Tax=Paramecium sonneborni TaxID=65129 RepID=A0A8S1RSN1_9CILI|nr:unnamed protein product [Paramecium sonneborni]